MLTAKEHSDLQDLFNEDTGDSGIACCTAIKDVIAKLGVVLPTIEDVRAVEEELLAGLA